MYLFSFVLLEYTVLKSTPAAAVQCMRQLTLSLKKCHAGTETLSSRLAQYV